MDALVQYGVACILARIGVCCHLRQHIIHLLGCLEVVCPKELQQHEYLQLQEQVGDPPHVVVRGVSHAQEVAQKLHEQRHKAQEGRPARAVGRPLPPCGSRLLRRGLQVVVLPVHDKDPHHWLHDCDKHVVDATV